MENTGFEKLLTEQKLLLEHPLYSEVKTLPRLKLFMETHIYAVWDFMSLLKSLQREITCVSIPWSPSVYPPEMVRLINEIVLGEESDLDQQGQPCSHFVLYLKAMEEVGADTQGVQKFLRSPQMELVPVVARDFVQHNLHLALKGDVVEVAAAFFYGREKLIPPMFHNLVQVLDQNNLKAPTLRYYLERHIAVDAEEHGPLAERCLESLVSESVEKQRLAHSAGVAALTKRRELWDRLLETFLVIDSK